MITACLRRPRQRLQAAVLITSTRDLDRNTTVATQCKDLTKPSLGEGATCLIGAFAPTGWAVLSRPDSRLAVTGSARLRGPRPPSPRANRCRLRCGRAR